MKLTSSDSIMLAYCAFLFGNTYALWQMYRSIVLMRKLFIEKESQRVAELEEERSRLLKLLQSRR